MAFDLSGTGFFQHICFSFFQSLEELTLSGLSVGGLNFVASASFPGKGVPLQKTLF